MKILKNCEKAAIWSRLKIRDVNKNKSNPVSGSAARSVGRQQHDRWVSMRALQQKPDFLNAVEAAYTERAHQAQQGTDL